MIEIKNIAVLILALTLLGCGNSICPDGTTPIRDAEGNVVDCFDPLDQLENKNDSSVHNKA